MSPSIDVAQNLDQLNLNGTERKKYAGRCDMQLGDITHHNVLQLKRLNQAVFPVTYNDKFYSEVVNAGNLAKLAYFNDVVVGAVCCRIDVYDGQKALYIMTLGTLAPYRQMGIGQLLLQHVFDIVKRDTSFRFVYLHVQISNETALHFYKKYGFEHKGIAEKYYKRIEPADAKIIAMSYKLSYFDIRGLAEPIRLLLADNGIKFEDHRFSRDDWPKLKSQMQFGQVPCLYDGDEQIVQSGAIIRHLARKHNLNGSNESETTFIDMFSEGVRDVHTKYTKMIYGDYENGKAPFIAEILPAELTKLESLLKTYLNGEKYVAGEKVSYADYMLFEELDIALILTPSALDNFPVLKAFHQRFTNRPSLKTYLDKRAAANGPVNGNGKQ